jgi:hypothetical protein
MSDKLLFSIAPGAIEWLKSNDPFGINTMLKSIGAWAADYQAAQEAIGGMLLTEVANAVRAHESRESVAALAALSTGQLFAQMAASVSHYSMAIDAVRALALTDTPIQSFAHQAIASLAMSGAQESKSIQELGDIG